MPFPSFISSKKPLKSPHPYATAHPPQDIFHIKQPSLKLDVDLSPQPSLQDYIPAHLLSGDPPLQEQLNDDAQSEPDDISEYSYDDVAANLESLDASDFLNSPHPTSRPDFPASSQFPFQNKKAAPTPIKIPNLSLHAPRVQVLRSPFEDKRLSRLSMTASQESSNDVEADAESAVSGTTLARALLANTFVLSSDSPHSREKRSPYRRSVTSTLTTFTALTRTDSATLPKGEHPLFKENDQDDSDIPPVPQLPPELIIYPPVRPTPSRELSDRRLSLNNPSPPSSLPSSPPVLSPAVTDPEPSRLSTATRTSTTSSDTTGRKEIDNVLDYYDSISPLPDQEHNTVPPVAGFRPPFSPISEESPSQLSTPPTGNGTPVSAVTSKSSGKPPRRDSFHLVLNPTLGGGLGVIERREVPPGGIRNGAMRTPLLPIGSGERRRSAAQLHMAQPLPSSSSHSLEESSNKLSAPPTFTSRSRSGSAPAPIRIVHDTRDLVTLSTTPSPSGLGPNASENHQSVLPNTASEEGVSNIPDPNILQTFPETPSVFSPMWSPASGVTASSRDVMSMMIPDGFQFSNSQSGWNVMEDVPQTPMSAGLPFDRTISRDGNMMMSLTHQVLLTRAATTVRHSRIGSLGGRFKGIVQGNTAAELAPVVNQNASSSSLTSVPSTVIPETEQVEEEDRHVEADATPLPTDPEPSQPDEDPTGESNDSAMSSPSLYSGTQYSHEHTTTATEEPPLPLLQRETTEALFEPSIRTSSRQGEQHKNTSSTSLAVSAVSNRSGGTMRTPASSQTSLVSSLKDLPPVPLSPVAEPEDGSQMSYTSVVDVAQHDREAIIPPQPRYPPPPPPSMSEDTVSLTSPTLLPYALPSPPLEVRRNPSSSSLSTTPAPSLSIDNQRAPLHTDAGPLTPRLELPSVITPSPTSLSHDFGYHENDLRLEPGITSRTVSQAPSFTSSLGSPPPYDYIMNGQHIEMANHTTIQFQYEQRQREPQIQYQNTRELSLNATPSSSGSGQFPPHTPLIQTPNSSQLSHFNTARQSTVSNGNQRRGRSRPPLPIGPRRPGPPGSAARDRRNQSISSITSLRTESNMLRTPQLFSPVAVTPTSPPNSHLHTQSVTMPASTSYVLPSPRFQPPALRYRGYTMDAAKWTFTSAELQAIVSRAIRASSEANSIRLLKLETLDSEIPDDLNKLEGLIHELKGRYKALARRRGELLGTLSSTVVDDDDNGAYVLKMVDELKDISFQLDRLAEDLYTSQAQIAQLNSLAEVHSSSALAMALRKLNTSFLRQLTDSQTLRAQIEELRGERDEAWQQAEKMAHEVDYLRETLASDSAQAGPSTTSSQQQAEKRSSRISARRKSSIRALKAGLRSARSSVSSINRISGVSTIPSAAKSAFSIEDIPPVPPIPRHRPIDIRTDLASRASMGMSTDGPTPNSETRAMLKAHEELCEMLGITSADFRLRRSASVRERSASVHERPLEFDARALDRSPSNRSSGRPTSLPDSSGLFEVYNAMTADRHAMLATLGMLSD